MLGRHRDLLREAWVRFAGAELSTHGDSFFVAFWDSDAAISACALGQRLLAAESWPDGAAIRVRMGLHTGAAVPDPTGDYTALVVHQAARVAACAHGGQTVVSEATVDACDQPPIQLRDLGLHRVRDFSEPVRLFQVVDTARFVDFGPLVGVGALEPYAGLGLPAWLCSSGPEPFVGRAAELELIGGACGDALGGCPRGIIVAGEPGLGKTWLIAQAAQAARASRMLVLAGRCDPDAGAPFGCWAEALSHLVRALDPLALPGHLGRWPGELSRLVPELSELAPELEPALASDPDTERWRLFDSVVSALRSLAEDTGVVVVIDDLQWASAPTLALIGHVLRAETPLRVAILMTYRNTETDDTDHVAAAMAGLREIAGVQRIDLGGFDDETMKAFVEGVAGRELSAEGAAFSSRLCADTAGNPFFAGEVLRHLAETGHLQFRDGRWELTTETETLELPDRVRDVIGRRLGRLGPDANQALGTAAVLGPQFSVDEVAHVAVVDGEACIDVLERAAAAHLVSETGIDQWRFVHALVRSTLLEQMSATRRARLHRRAAELLASSQQTDPAAIAHHWSQASGQDASENLCLWLTRAGDDALDRLAPEDAAMFYDRALATLDTRTDPVTRIETSIRLGTAQRLAGDSTYRATLIAASEDAVRHGDGVLLARATIANSRGLFSAVGQVDEERIALLDQALSSLPPNQPRLRARLLVTLATELVFSISRDRRFWLCDQALHEARALGDDDLLVDVLLARAQTLPAPAMVGALWAEGTELSAMTERVGDPLRTLMSEVCWASTSRYVGRLETASERLAAAVSLANDLGQPTAQWMIGAHDSGHQLLVGDLERAEAVAIQSLASGERAGETDAATWFGALIVFIRWDQARLDEVVDLVAAEAAKAPNLPVWKAFLAMAYVEVGRTDEARAAFEGCAANQFQGLPIDHFWLLALCLAADACIKIGTPTEAQQIYELLAPWEHLHASGSIFSIGSVGRALGNMAAMQGRSNAAITHLERAIDANQRIGSPAWIATAMLDLATILPHRESAHHSEAASALAHQALEIVHGLGINRVEQRAIAFLEPSSSAPIL